jgi:hypothetical protein
MKGMLDAELSTNRMKGKLEAVLSTNRMKGKLEAAHSTNRMKGSWGERKQERPTGKTKIINITLPLLE